MTTSLTDRHSHTLGHVVAYMDQDRTPWSYGREGAIVEAQALVRAGVPQAQVWRVDQTGGVLTHTLVFTAEAGQGAQAA